jgi:hypothetical protein
LALTRHGGRPINVAKHQKIRHERRIFPIADDKNLHLYSGEGFYRYATNKSMGLLFSDGAWVGDRAIKPCSLNNPKDDDSAMDHSIDQILHIKDHIVGACADR